ncbi:MAG: beta-exotoxin transport system ATP-binding protein [Micromonosporaceae bacterium]|jgi:ABC-2 type transport system ATP-binding protein|nr:beta-exotoxin transport system ATP-binding protein [Micromonosporaceae bacterium]MDT5035843.1 beta-exotoxin transport system ATP-binding protein [Micromonosporaceae bacterium]
MVDTGSVVYAENLTKHYGGRRGLEGLDLAVTAGEVFGYLGPNGAGKTTTIRLMLDFIRPSGGTVRVLGEDPRHGAASRGRIGYLPGELRFEGRDKAIDLLRFFADARGGVPINRIKNLAGRLDLDLQQGIRTMSKGNKQKIGLVQAFMHEPELLVLDEPTSGLDPLMQQEFQAMVREARGNGQTVFMSSHVLAEVQETADRVGIVREGRMIAVERVESLGKRAVRRVEVHFTTPVPADDFVGIAGVKNLSIEGTVLRCEMDGQLDPLIKAIARHTVADMLIQEPDLEDTFLSYYYDQEGEVNA